jgi:hypothetical protein
MKLAEKSLTSCQHPAKQRGLVVAPFQHRMEEQGEEVEAEHHRREVLLAMSKVVLPMGAFGLEYIVVFIVDLPPPTACLRHRRDVFCRDTVIGDQAGVVELFARFGVDHRDLAPMDRQGLFPVEQEHVIARAIHRHFREAAIPVTAFPRGDAVVGVPKGDALVQLRMGIGCAHEDEVEALCQSQGTQGVGASIMASATPFCFHAM